MGFFEDLAKRNQTSLTQRDEYGNLTPTIDRGPGFESLSGLQQNLFARGYGTTDAQRNYYGNITGVAPHPDSYSLDGGMSTNPYGSSVLGKQFQGWDDYYSKLSPELSFLRTADQATPGAVGGDYDRLFSQLGPDQGHIARSLADLGVSDWNNLKVAQLPGIDKNAGLQDVFYDSSTGKIIPTQFGKDTGGKNSFFYTLQRDAQGNVIPFTKHERDTSVGDFTKAAILAFSGGYAAAGLAGAGAAGVGASAGGGAATGTTAAGGTASGFGATAGGLGSGLSTAGSSFGAGLGGVGSGFGAAGAAGGTTLGSGLGMLGSGTSFLGAAGMSGLGTGGAAAGGGLSTLKSAYDLYSKGSNAYKLYNAATGSGAPQQGQQNMALSEQNLLPFLAGLYNTYGNNTAGTLEDNSHAALQRGDPFGGQRAGYQQKLADTYTNPQGVYDSQYSALDEQFFKELKAQDAARGRSTDAYKRGTEREAKFQDWMTGYRGQLGGFAGAQIDPSRMAGEYLASMNNAALLGNYNNQSAIQGLGSLFGGSGSGGLSLNDIISGGKSLWDAGSSAYNWASDYDWGSLFS